MHGLHSVGSASVVLLDVHVGVPEPIRVVAVKAHERADYQAALLELTRASMQASLDDINRRVAPAVEGLAVENWLN